MRYKMQNPFVTIFNLISESEMSFRIAIFELFILFEFILLTQSLLLFLFQFILILIWIWDNA